jgi:hypothetical protein
MFSLAGGASPAGFGRLARSRLHTEGEHAVACHTAVAKGTDVDQRRNLAKTREE